MTHFLNRLSSVTVALSIAFLALCFFVPTVFAAGEKIDLFSADLTLHQDSSVSVIETITYDFGTNEKHGIFRYIPTTHPDPSSKWYLDRHIDIEVESVSRDGNPEPFTLSNERSRIYLKIGSADSTIVGQHTYVITYTLRGALSVHKDADDEFYWNVTGNDWQVGMLTARATLNDPDGVLIKKRSCYQGTRGENSSCAITDTQNGVRFETRNLAPYEGITIANAVDRTKVKVEQVEIAKPFAKTGVLSLLAFLWLLWFGFYVYRYRTEHRGGDTIIAQYEPYKGILPMYTGVLMDASLDPKDLTAGIVYLAEQGYLKIKKIEKKVLFFFEVDDYEISMVKKLESGAEQFSEDVLSLLFGQGAEVGASVTLGTLKSDTAKQRENLTTLMKLKSDVIKDLASRGFYEMAGSKKLIRWVVRAGLGLVVALALLYKFDTFAPDWIIVIVTAVVTFIMIGITYRRLTKKGDEASNHLEGFKLFLEVTETERLKFHNAPAKSPEQFMEFLPYAIAFGVEKEWAKVFEGITIPNPSWYDGNASTFSAINLTNSLGGFSTAFASSSGSSASSGGGSSGGGGGGGGGGSW